MAFEHDRTNKGVHETTFHVFSALQGEEVESTQITWESIAGLCRHLHHRPQPRCHAET